MKSLTIDPLRLVHCIDVIRRFVKHRSDFHYGYLSHALAAELENFIQEVNMQIINFETRQKGKRVAIKYTFVADFCSTERIVKIFFEISENLCSRPGTFSRV